MAELLKDRTANREVVMQHDVLYLIEVLGKPEQYVEEEEQQQPNSSANATANLFGYQTTILRHRRPQNRRGIIRHCTLFQHQPHQIAHRLCDTLHFFLYSPEGDGSYLSTQLAELC